MMAVILSLFLTISSSAAYATDINLDYLLNGKDKSFINSKNQVLRSSTLSRYRGEINQLMNKTVVVFGEEGIGSGVLLSKKSVSKLGLADQLQYFDKLIVTNFHVVEAPDDYSVAFYPLDGVDLENAPYARATILSIVPEKDIALVGVNGDFNDYIGAEINIDSATISVGENVEAIGHPHSNLWSYSRGYVSQIRKNYTWSYSSSDYKADVIQTQTPINGGNSGGPLFNDSGVVVGINSFGDNNAEGLNFAIESTELLDLRNKITETNDAIKEWNSWVEKNEEQLLSYLSMQFELIDTVLMDNSDNLKIHSFDLNNDGIEDMLVYFDEQNFANFAFYYGDSAKPNAYFSLNHQNHTAVFLVSIDEEGDGEIDMDGWDFNGDFDVDFIINKG